MQKSFRTIDAVKTGIKENVNNGEDYQVIKSKLSDGCNGDKGDTIYWLETGNDIGMIRSNEELIII